jgi:glutamate-5-semialdehyde dehydrogenase
MNLEKQFVKVKEASIELPLLSHEHKKEVLLDLAKRLIDNQEQIIKKNSEDLLLLSKEDPKYDRLLLNPSRIKAMAQGLEAISKLPSPIWKTQEEYTLPSGLTLKKVSVPLGVIGLVYEARPNVTIEAFSLCFMSSNACILKGAMDARNSNEILVSLIQLSLQQFSMPLNCVLLMPHERESVKTLLTAKQYVDVIIPRGGQALIDFVKKESLIPIIETGAGVVHVYFDSSGDKVKGKKIITNAKTRRVSVCNALDCLLVHKDRLKDLPYLLSDLIAHDVMILADDEAFNQIQKFYPLTLLHHSEPSDYGQEFLSYKLAIKTVDDFNHALKHIREYSSGHSVAIIAEENETINEYFQRVDAAVLYANASTAFTDGGEFGMGGEIGISTQKLHVRGPFSLQHLVSSKWLVKGSGQTRD